MSMGSSEFVDQYYREPELTEQELNLRREFVKAYMRYRNPYRACLELGFMEAYARDWAQKLMDDGTVRRMITEADQAEDSEDATIERQRKYRAWLEHEATYYGPGCAHGSRVSAITQLMKLEGMEPATKTEATLNYASGVMVVPALTSPDQWGSVAEAAQKELKDKVRD